LWSVDPAVTSRRAFAVTGAAAVGLLIAENMTRARAWRSLTFAFGLMATGSLIMVIAFPHLGVHGDVHAGSWRGLLAHKNPLGWLMAVAAIVLLTAAYHGVVQRRMATLLTIICIVVLAGASSATGWLALVVGLGSLALVAILQRAGRAWPFFFVATAIVCWSTVMHGEVLAATVLDLVGRDATLSGRTQIWTALEPSIRNRWLLGHGYQAFWTSAEAEGAMRGAFYSSFVASHAHNGFVDLLLDLGVLGVALYATLLVKTIVALCKRATKGDAFASMLFSVVITTQFMGLSGATIFQANSIHWTLMTLAIAYASTSGMAKTIPTSTRHLVARSADILQAAARERHPNGPLARCGTR
jgi:O-antigen ligase